MSDEPQRAEESLNTFFKRVVDEEMRAVRTRIRERTGVSVYECVAGIHQHAVKDATPSLRDQFAMCAIQGLINRDRAKGAYVIADEMLAAREVK